MSLYTSHYPNASLLSNLFVRAAALYVRLHVTGSEHIPTTGAWILAANHTSHADTAVLYASVPRTARRRLLAAAARDYFFNKQLRQHTARLLFNAIPVDRESADGQDPLRHVIRALREGYGVLIYPEGTRSRDGRIGPFRSGIGRLMALFPTVPVIPAFIAGTSQVLPKGWGMPVPHRVSVTFGAPLYLQPDPDDHATWRTAADRVREEIIRLGALDQTEGAADTAHD